MTAFALARHDHGCYWHKEFVHECQKAAERKSPCVGLHDDEMDADGLVGLKSDNKCKPAASSNVKSTSVQNADAYFTPEVRQELRKMYDAAPNEKPKLEDCQVAVHVRRGDAGKPFNKHHCNRLMPNDKLYQVITSNFANKKVCVFSEGKPEDFGKVKELGYVKFMLNGQTDYPFHNFVMAPELVIAKSSFSYTAALLNQAKLTNDPTLQPVLTKVSEEESLCEV